ncbi:MAG TPA: SRPBCC family protein [Verrucomicrobiae bacterium]|nr:SRPBCC family protein [Verrucomicrobiae bacterium]
MHVEKSIEVEAPLDKVYNQWTQFEDFPKFMQGIEQVKQLDDKRLHWVAEIGGKKKEWDAEIFEQVPDQKIAWRSTSGAPNAGIVSFRPIAANRTHVTVRMEYDPEGAIENIGAALGAVGTRIDGDLKRFRDFIQTRIQETGAWRGEIRAGRVESKDAGDSPTPPPPSSGTAGYGTSGKSGLP